MSNAVKYRKCKHILRLFTDHRRYGTLFFFGFTGLFLIIGLAFFITSIDRSYTGIELSKDNRGTWTVASVDPNGVAYQQGIQVGDIPLEVNNQPAQDYLEKYVDVGFVSEPLIRELSVADQNGNLKTVVLKDSSPSINAIIELSVWWLTSMIFWAVGIYVFSKKSESIVAKLFCICSVFYGLTLSANAAGVRAIPFAIAFSVCALAVSPFLLLHFFLILPEERTEIRSNKLIYLIYLPAVVTIILFPVIGYADGQPVPWFRNVRLVEFILAMLAVAGVAVYNFTHTSSPRTRQQMKIVLVSTVAALVPFLAFGLLFPAIWKQTSVPYGFNMLFMSLIPLGMGYAVITTRLLDIDVIIRRGVIYSLITVGMAIILSIGIFPAIVFRESFGIAVEFLITLVLGALATILFGPLRKASEALVDRVFYKDRYDYRKIIQDLSSSLNRLSDFDDMSRLVVSLTANTLNLSGVCLFIRSQSGSLELKAVQGIFEDSDKQLRLVDLIDNRDIMSEFPNTASSLNSDVEYLIHLETGERDVGFLCVSPKASRQGFSNDDIYLLQGIAAVAASAVRSAMLVRDVSLRNTFVSIASHELRAPLTTIVGFADLLLRRNPPEEKKKTWVKNIYNNAAKLSEMVDELLNITRIQSGKIRLQIEPVQLPLILEEQLDIVRQSTEKHEFLIDIEPSLPGAMIDRDKFSHVVGNLLNNAVKYSPQGGRITLSAHHDPDRNRIVVAVTDEGIGIAPADVRSLFSTFHRIQRPETTGIGGSGLGLYIAKEWIKAMGGDIWLESELDKGTTFFLEVPVQSSKSVEKST